MEAKKVFKKIEDVVLIPNVRDAVRGLAGDSDLIGPVEFYGDRFAVMPVDTLVRKASRSSQEAQTMKSFDEFLAHYKIGAKRFIEVPSFNGGNDGLVSRLSNVDAKNFLSEANGDLKFFINSPGVEKVSSRLGKNVLGTSVPLSEKMNNKVYQREISQRLDEKIFPDNFIVESEEEALIAFDKLFAKGRVMGKVGHLASGEGFQVFQERVEVSEFWRKWVRVLADNNLERKIVIEQLVDLADDHNSVSVQFFVNEADVHYLGASVQHIGADGFEHKGNMVGSGIRSVLNHSVEEKMIKMSGAMMRAVDGIRGFIGFDFVISSNGDVLMTECNLRITASTILFALSAQIGEHLSYDLRKIRVGSSPRLGAVDFFAELKKFNSENCLMIPLNPRLFDETGEMFVATIAPTFSQINETQERVLSWF